MRFGRIPPLELCDSSVLQMPLTSIRLTVDLDRRWTLRSIGVSPSLTAMALVPAMLEAPVLLPPLCAIVTVMTIVMMVTMVTNVTSYPPGFRDPVLPDDPVCVPSAVLASVADRGRRLPLRPAVLVLLRVLAGDDTGPSSPAPLTTRRDRGRLFVRG